MSSCAMGAGVLPGCRMYNVQPDVISIRALLSPILENSGRRRHSTGVSDRIGIVDHHLRIPMGKKKYYIFHRRNVGQQLSPSRSGRWFLLFRLHISASFVALRKVRGFPGLSASDAIVRWHHGVVTFLAVFKRLAIIYCPSARSFFQTRFPFPVDRYRSVKAFHINKTIKVETRHLNLIEAKLK